MVNEKSSESKYPYVWNAYCRGTSCKDIAEEFGIAKSYVYQIVRYYKDKNGVERVKNNRSNKLQGIKLRGLTDPDDKELEQIRETGRYVDVLDQFAYSMQLINQKAAGGATKDNLSENVKKLANAFVFLCEA